MKKYRVEIKRSAAKEIAQLQKRDLIAVLKRIEELVDDPRPKDAKKLSAQEAYRIRHGNYRIVYVIEDAIVTVFVIKVAHRKDVYR